MLGKIKTIFKENWRRQSIIVITFTCLMINVFAVTLYVQSEKVNDSKNWVIHSYEVLRQTRLLLVNVQDMQIGQRGFFLSNKPEFLAPYEVARAKIDTVSKELNRLIKDNPEQYKRALEIEKDINDHQIILDDQIQKFKEKQRSITVKDLTESAAFLTNIRKKITEFQIAEKELLDTRQIEESKRRNEYTRTIIFGSILAVLGLIIANSFVIYQAIKRRRAEEGLKRSEEIYSLVTQGINEGIYDYNIDDGKIFYSTGFKQMLGYDDSSFANTVESFNEHLHPEDFKGAWEIINQFLESKETLYRNIFRLRHKDGNYLWIMSRGVAIRDNKGKIKRLIGTHTDITDQKEAEEYLKRLNTDLENFTYITSHDLRSPLVNLKGFASEMQFSLQELTKLLSKSLSKKDEGTKNITNIVEQDLPEALGYIKTSVERLDQLTTAILDLSRIGKRELKIETVNVEEMIKKIVDSMAYEINNKKVEVKIGELPEINTDRIALQQIFSNIIENAVKYLDESRAGIINIKGTAFPGEIQYIVSDTGRGIEEGDKERIFDMFKRARNVKEVRGVGMGMAFVKATVQRLGGKIWFESTVNVGTKFIFTIPNKVRRNAYHD